MEHGIGPIKSVLLAQRIGSKMLKVHVLPSLTTVLLMLPMVTAPLATKDTILSMELASSLLPTMPGPLTLDVLLGIGKSKSASLVPRTGLRVPVVNVFPLLTNVPLMPLTEIVLLASRDMTSLKDNAFSLLPIT